MKLLELMGWIIEGNMRGKVFRAETGKESMTSSASQLVSAVSELPSSGQSLDAVAPPILPKTDKDEWMERSIDRLIG